MSGHDLLCIYHKNCRDGFGAAWIVRRKMVGTSHSFYAANYSEDPPDVLNRHVLIVDFSYPKEILQEMSRSAISIMIIDHHKTAAEDLKGIPTIDHYREWESAIRNSIQSPNNIFSYFDMKRSGAGLTWDFFHYPAERPQIINRIEDHDLWRFQYKDTREVVTAISSYSQNFKTWDSLIDVHPFEKLVEEGTTIDRYRKKQLSTLLESTKRVMSIGGYEIPVANVPPMFASDAGHIMCMSVDTLFSATYYDTKNKRVFSLRSDGDFDVSAVAKSYGGGGHKAAAGFSRDIGWEGDSGTYD